VRRIAFEMNNYQGPELDQLRRWARSWGSGMAMTHRTGGTAGGPMGMPADDDLARLKASRGPAFDRLFLTLMITHHEGAVTMARAEVVSGNVPAAVVMAGQIVTVQQQQLAAMRGLLAELGPA
jgi:uncharacterized protein (DUF305 family)